MLFAPAFYLKGLIFINIKDLIPYENNPRINDDAVEAVANSIKEFGFKVPIIIDKNNVIVAGHTRLKAAQKLGLEEVPVIVADDLTEEQIKAFRLADNKVSELSGWDFEKLKQELAELEMDMSQFNFDMKELSAEFDKFKEVEEDEFDVEKELESIIEPVCQIGEVWKLGEQDPNKGFEKNLYSKVYEGNKDSDNELSYSKPLGICEKFIKLYSNDNDVIADLFGGSGSTLIACEQLKRKCYTMELDPKYCDVIIKRWETLTGNKAILN